MSYYWWSGVWFGEGDGTLLQHSCLENPMDRRAWKAAVHGVAKSRTRLSDWSDLIWFSRFDARYWMLGAGALGRLRGMVWGGRREEGSGWGTCVYLWWIHIDIWQNQYNIVKLKNKIKKKKKYKKCKTHNNLINY